MADSFFFLFAKLSTCLRVCVCLCAFTQKYDCERNKEAPVTTKKNDTIILMMIMIMIMMFN